MNLVAHIIKLVKQKPVRAVPRTVLTLINYPIMKNIIFILLLILTYACVKKEDESIISSHGTKNNCLDYTIDTVIIDLDSISKPYYFGKINILETDSGIFYYAYNSRANTIDWFNLVQKKITHTPIITDGPYAIKDVNAIYAITMDSIFISSYNNIYIINKNGQVYSKIKTSVTNSNGKRAVFCASVNFNMFYDSFNHEIYTGVYYINNEDNKTQPRAIKYNTITHKYTFLPIFLSDDYNQKYDLLGYINNFNISFYNDMLIYNFDYSSDFKVYNYKTKKISTIKSADNLAEKKIELTGSNPDDRKKMELYVSNSQYNNPIKSNNYYYRLSWTGASSSTGINGKRIVLAKYDKNLSHFTEAYIDNKTYFFGSEMPMKNGFVIIAQHSQSPHVDFEKIKFHIFRFKP